MGKDVEIAQLEHQLPLENPYDTGDYAPAEIQKEVQNLEDPDWIRAQKKYLRKLDFIILPTISSFYFFEYLDRGNIAVSPSPSVHSYPC